MEKQILLTELKKISDHYFQKKDYISAGQINLAMDVVEDYDVVSLQADDVYVKTLTPNPSAVDFADWKDGLLDVELKYFDDDNVFIRFKNNRELYEIFTKQLNG